MKLFLFEVKIAIIYGRYKKWDLRPGTVGGTQDPRLPTYHIGETWVPKNGT